MDAAKGSRRVLITGGARGIGLGIACAFRSLSDRVTVTGLTEHEVHAVQARHDGIDAVVMDVTRPVDVERVVGALERLDVLVNCAGTIAREGREHSMLGFARTVEVNLHGTARVSYACRPLLTKARGSVVNLASMLSIFGSGASPGYSASKGAVVQLTKSLAIAWAPVGVRVNAVAPGWIETELTRQIIEDDPQRDAEIRHRTPMARWGRTEDVAGAATFLAGDDARFITGVVLPVDGGYSIR